MNKTLAILGLVAAVVLLAGAVAPPAAAEPPVRVRLLNPPPGGMLTLAVGESYTFEIEISTREPFILAGAMTDAYYPGRGVIWHGGDRAHHDTYALLHLTVTGKKSTAGLAAVCGWPEAGDCWDEGVAPLAIVAGPKFKYGLVYPETFAFGVVVP